MRAVAEADEQGLALVRLELWRIVEQLIVELVGKLTFPLEIIYNLLPNKRYNLGIIKQIYQMRNLVGVDVDDILLHEIVHQLPFLLPELAEPKVEVAHELDARHKLVVGIVFDVGHEVNFL